MDNRIDIKENYIQQIDDKLLSKLLIDRTSGNNIIWASDDYVQYGEGYSFESQITVESITGEHGNVIRPRVEKTKEEKNSRSKDRAEVFTPSWVCNKQNNLIDNEWFGRENVFNTETENGWISNQNKITFPDGKTWQDYVKLNRLEISCGEAPYLASRYDAVTGEIIPVADRIGLLDRKLRVVSENCDSEPEWVEWAFKALQSIYGFDWQGDNVLLARENILFTFSDYYSSKFPVPPIKEYLDKIARIVSWNIWQMDGIKFVIPNSCKDEIIKTQTFFGEEEQIIECEGCKNNDYTKHNGVYCRIYDWSANKSVEFYTLMKGARLNGNI